MTLDEIDITDNLVWIDEFQFNQIEQVRDRMLHGGLAIQGGEKLYGRPITLEGWLPRATLDALRTKENQGNLVMTLTLPDAREFSVVFDRSRGIAIDAEPLLPYTKASQEPAWQYDATLRLLTVPAA